MKNIVVLLFFVPLFAGAQITHTVKAKETLYSLARKYNVHPRELASFNNIPVETSLVLGQVIKIPAKPTMAPLAAPPANTENVRIKTETTAPVSKEVEKKQPEPIQPAAGKDKPVYHKVGKKETLYAISKKYDNVSIADIKKWNKLTGDGLSEGSNLIVGFGTVKDAVPAEQGNPVKEKNEIPANPAMKEAEQVVAKQPAQEKPEPVKKAAEMPAMKEQVKEAAVNITGKDFKGGVFKGLYDQQTVNKDKLSEEKGTAGIFKSTSGWEDGKYYCLSNAVPAGTIVKITYPATRKYVYAKVLDLIPDLKQNSGIIIRLSNSAAQELGVNEEIFECTINF